MERDHSLTPCIVGNIALNTKGHFQGEGQLPQFSSLNHLSSADQGLDMAFDPMKGAEGQSPIMVLTLHCNEEFQRKEGGPFW